MADLFVDEGLMASRLRGYREAVVVVVGVGFIGRYFYSVLQLPWYWRYLRVVWCTFLSISPGYISTGMVLGWHWIGAGLTVD